MELDYQNEKLLVKGFPKLISDKIIFYYRKNNWIKKQHLHDHLIYFYYPPKPIQKPHGMFRWMFNDIPFDISKKQEERLFRLFEIDFDRIFRDKS